MNREMKKRIVSICDKKIAQKGGSVGVSFYAFFENKNENPELLMNVATWWIQTHRLDHFEKAVKIKKLVRSGKL